MNSLSVRRWPSGHINYLHIAPDKDSERLYQPYANELKHTLVLEDAGYFDIGYCFEIDKEGGFHIIRTSKTINPEIITAVDEQSKEIKGLKGKSLRSLKMQKQQVADTAKYLEKHARRANMKRDKDTPLFKYGCHPAMNF